MNLIGITGRKGHGKDTAAQILTANGWTVIKFADPLKAMIRAYMQCIGISDTTIEDCIEGDSKEVTCGWWNEKTTRFAMQTLGTEWGRRIIGETFWTNSFWLRSLGRSKVVCTDMRFPNERNMIKAMGGLTLRIVDPRKPISGDSHPSETEIDSLEVDYTVMNDGSIDQLHDKIRLIAEMEFGHV